MELRPLGGIAHSVFLSHHAQLIEEAVLRVFDPLQKGLFAVRFDELIRIFAGRKVDHLSFDPRLFQDPDTAERRSHSCAVIVIGQQHLFAVALEQGGLSLREGGPQGRDCLVKSGLVHGDHVHISLAEDLVGGLGSFGDMKAVQIPALVKYFCLGGIEIFGLGIPHHSAAEADDLPAHIHDRKHDPVPELVMHASLFVEGRDACFQYYIVRIAAAFEVRHQVIARAVRVSQAKIPHSHGIKLSVRQILQALASFGCTKQLVVVDRRLLVDRPQQLALFFPALCLFTVIDLRKFDPGPVRQCLQGLLKAVVLILHQKGRGVSACSASEAVKHLLGLRDGKGGRFLIMERTKAKIVGAFLL